MNGDVFISLFVIEVGREGATRQESSILKQQPGTEETVSAR